MVQRSIHTYRADLSLAVKNKHYVHIMPLGWCYC